MSDFLISQLCPECKPHIQPLVEVLRGERDSVILRLDELRAEQAIWAVAMKLGAEGTQFPRGIPDMTLMGKVLNHVVADFEVHDVMNLIVGMARSIPKIERARITELEARLREVAEERNNTLVPLRDAADALVAELNKDGGNTARVTVKILAYEKAKIPKKPFDPSDPTWDGERNCPKDEREGG